MPVRVVITDTNVLINLCIANGLFVLAALPELEFVTCPEVLSELTNAAHKKAVNGIISSGTLASVQVSSVVEHKTFNELRKMIGLGEAAALALAQHNNWLVASDEKRVFRREAVCRIGSSNLLTTVDLYRLAIRYGVITVEQADVAKATLERNRFRMPFLSFKDLDD